MESTSSVSGYFRPSRLDLATKLGRDVPDGWWVVVYPTAGEAVITFKRGLQTDRRTGAAWDVAPEDVPADRALIEAVRRARGQVRRYCTANGLDRLATVTYGGSGCHDEQQVRADLGAFFRQLRRIGGTGAFAYLWVVEWHPGGHGLHAHFAIGRYLEKGLLEQAWAHGFVEIRRINAELRYASALARARVAAAYLGKYVAKGFETSGGLHRYEVAQGFQPERWRFFAETREDAVNLCVNLRDGAIPNFSASDEWEGWQGPPTLWMQWPE